MGWIYLIVAGVLEIGWATGLKYTDGWTKLWPSVLTFLVMMASVYFLAVAVRDIPLGTGYAVWTGIGAAGTAIVGMVAYSEEVSVARIGCILLILAGVAGLKALSS